MKHALGRTGATLAVAGVGAVLAWSISAPVHMLTGPAVAVSLAGVAGLRVDIAPRLRDSCFVVLGLTVGAGFSADALETMMRWPLAFVVMAVLTWGVMVACRSVLVRGFGFARDSALLAGAPGHLSFVIAMAEGNGRDVVRISVTQSVRLLLLTLVVPFVAVAMGIDLAGAVLPQGQAWSIWVLACLALLAVVAARGLGHLRTPAPLLIGAMLVAGLWQLSGVQAGVMPDWLVMPSYLVLGALIGTRFAGVTAAELLRNLGAGLAITGVAVVFSGAAALGVAWALEMPQAHVLLAFAPGGLETMIAMGMVMGVLPGFVAACHITRLMVLSVLLPLMARSGAGQHRPLT
ncbi:AbrB family transcriptional regulator [Sulfitobacter guttiformis]|uniref:AbrB family transcriptional regulator n=1 Tax=Sulfitobacter guttiformis TaxID=74349 RepID=UPI00055B86F9|nr:AbrB family transcriptional regulator [Sulfitobacter guttiformis]